MVGHVAMAALSLCNCAVPSGASRRPNPTHLQEGTWLASMHHSAAVQRIDKCPAPRAAFTITTRHF